MSSPPTLSMDCQQYSSGRTMGSISLDQEPAVWCCIGSGDTLLSSGFFQDFTMTLLLCPYFSELWAFYSHRGIFCAGGWVCDHRLASRAPPREHLCMTFCPWSQGFFFSCHCLLISLSSLSLYTVLGCFFAMGDTGGGKDLQLCYQPLGISLQASVQLCFKEALLSVVLQPAYPTLYPTTWPCFNILPPPSFFSKDFLKWL